ncbi:cobalamin synthesis protein, P47K [Caballeronia pedi]|uniref:Cobalamin synthesis protein, P47K n=1 Tax=Caballeronia pedi TaxID=1777141 RepID=A0A158CGK6_9BURK|nr:GTP-binding protein [Caballeronia pedi]SAK81400.1 cobalamin synthesis protein, P47K [Caballeronia pedi]
MKAPATQFVMLAGMLGSGKTSLLEALLSDSAAQTSTAIIVNEVGAVNIDGAVLSESARGTAMATLSNGCVCCSLNNDLVMTIEDLVASRIEAGLPAFDRIVLECSGLSRPGEVMRSLNPLAAMGLRVHIAVTYDCSRPPLDGDSFDDVAAQLGAAHTIVLTKTDLVGDEQRSLERARIARINPLAHLVDEDSLRERARAALRDIASGQALIAHEADDGRRSSRVLLHPRLRVFCARFHGAPEWEQTLEWMENISGALGGRLLRMKAIVAGPAPGDRILMQSVGTTFAAPRRLSPTSAPDMAAVFIVRDCGMQELEEAGMSGVVRWSSLQG